MEYRPATKDELERIWDRSIAENPDDVRWAQWKREYIENYLSGKALTFLVLDSGDPVGEGTLLFSPECSAVSGRLALCDGKRTANVNALRIRKAYEGQGHMSRLVREMEAYACHQGIHRLTIGAEAREARNLAIYLHLGYTEFLFSQVEDGELVLYYGKSLEKYQEERTMERIASFQVDHNKLAPGMYLSRRDGNVTTLDLRFKKPNTGDLLSNAEMHSVEHIIATLLRNGRAKDAIIYFGPMGCQTGFYLLYDSNQLSDGDAVELVKETFAAGAAFDGPMPGKSAAECGNYINLDVELAKKQCAFYSGIIKDWTEEKLAY